jgi:hypothetical protein
MESPALSNGNANTLKTWLNVTRVIVIGESLNRHEVYYGYVQYFSLNRVDLNTEG